MHTELNTKTNKELLGIYNGLADKPLAAWKGKKSDLIDRIEALGTAPTDDVPPAVVEKAATPETVNTAAGKSERTIREAALAWLCHVEYYEDRDGKSGPDNVVKEDHPKARSVGITYLDIIDRIKQEFPDCDTSVACLRWYSVKVRTHELGYEDYRLCQRRPRATPKRS